MIELKPCPFCGSSNIEIMEWIPSTYSVQCLNCEARTSREYSKTLSIERWNTRCSSEEICPQFGIPGASCSEPETLCSQYKFCMKARELSDLDKLPEWFVKKLSKTIIDCKLRAEELRDENDIEESVNVSRRANNFEYVLSLRRGEE